MDHEDAKEEVRRLLETDKGQTLSPEEVREILMQANRESISIEGQNSTVRIMNKEGEFEFREIDWKKFLELLKNKLIKQ